MRAKPFRFTVQCSSPTTVTAGSWRELARRCEGQGYSTLTVSDHLDEQVGPVAALMAAADATTTLRVGAMVFCNDFRHPVALAKEAATLYANAPSATVGAERAEAAVALAAHNYGLPPAAMKVTLSENWCRACTVTAAVVVDIPAIVVPFVGTVGAFTYTATSSARIDDYRSFEPGATP